MQNPREPQEYDNSLKALFGDEAATILPQLLPGTELIDEQNIEIDRSKLRADLVYNVLQKGLPHILHMELQTGADADMPLRLLQYHVGLLVKHKKPVISVVLYPFKVKAPAPPFEEMSADEVVLFLKYQELRMWEMEACKFVQGHAVCVYTLLPAMKGASVSLLVQALEEMEQYYSKEELRHHLGRFYRIMQKSKTMSKYDKQQVKEVLDMQYGRDWFIDTMPEVIDRVAQGEARGEARGKVEGKVEGVQQSLLLIISTHFPALEKLAQQQVARITDLNVLHQLVKQIVIASSEEEVRQLLNRTIA